MNAEITEELQAEVTTLAREHGAIILAHNYQLPEIHKIWAMITDLGFHTEPLGTPMGPTAARNDDLGQGWPTRSTRSTPRA